MLQISGIKKAYGKTEILKGIELSAKEGDCIAIAGLNGCGKSTLLSILAGARKADAGSFMINGVDMLKHPAKRKALVAYVPQDNPLMEELSVYDNLMLWYCDAKKDLDEELKSGALKMLGIDEFKHKRVNQLSGGMKKRVSIGCAIAYDQPVLILDEPSAALDLACKENIKEFLKSHIERGGIILITTHDEAELSLCNHLMVMKNGTLKEADLSLRGSELLKCLSGENNG